MIFPSENMTQQHVEQNASLLWEKSKEHKHFFGGEYYFALSSSLKNASHGGFQFYLLDNKHHRYLHY